MEFTPISSRMCTIRIKTKPLNRYIVQINAPTSVKTDEHINKLYSQLQSKIDSMKNIYILIFQGDWNAKIGKHSVNNWSDYCETACNIATNDSGVNLLEFEIYKDLIQANT